MKRALILGITGQDGSYLADLLLEKGCAVAGMVRRSSSEPANLWRIKHLLDRVILYSGDLSDPASVCRILDDVRPDLIFNEADQDHVGWSYKTPGYSIDVTAGAVVRLLEAVRCNHPAARVFQPLSATMFGNAPPPQNEQTPFAPASPYAVAKTAAYYACQHYRREYGLFVSTAIFYNHDSERRGGDYLLQKIARGAVAVARKQRETLLIGDEDARVDVGYAPEYIDAAWRIIQLDRPDNFVIGTGREVTVRDLAAEALRTVGFCNWRFFLSVDTEFKRPGIPPILIADCRYARNVFGWEPKHDAGSVVRMLVKHFLQEQE